MAYPPKLTAESILHAARTLLETGGPDALTMRTLADHLGVRASSLYRHHPSRDALLHALREQAALALRDHLQAATGPDPRRTLEAAAAAYLGYARTHPHLYALLLQKTPDVTPEDLARSAPKQLWNTLLRLVGQVSGNPDDTDHAVAYWTFLHGFASLEASGTYGPSGPKGGFQVGLQALLNHMQPAAPRPPSG